VCVLEPSEQISVELLPARLCHQCEFVCVGQGKAHPIPVFAANPVTRMRIPRSSARKSSSSLVGLLHAGV